MKYIDSQELLNNTSVVLGASETDTVVSENFNIDNPLFLAIDITAGSTTVVTGVTAKLQMRSCGGTWIDSKTVSITGNDDFKIELLAQRSGDQQYLPLRKQCRVVVSSGSLDAATISSVIVTKGG